ncbi:MAG: tyrosine-type recombinase/integrase [Candidatus Tyrphobacter sp.]
MARAAKTTPGRRADGEGSIYETPRTYRLADGSERTKIYWCAEIRWTDPDDKQRRDRAQHASKSEAKEWLKRKRIEIASDKVATSDEKRVTVREALDAWLEAKSRRIRPSTKTVYNAAIRHLEPLHTRRIVGLSPEHVRACIDRADLSPRLQIVMRMVLRASLRPYTRLIREDLFPPGSSPKIRRPKLNVWTPEQATAFIRHTEHTRLGLLWRTALLTGMRRGELLGLRWKDIHDGWIEVSGSLDAQRELVDTKTSGSRRRITLDLHLNAALQEQRGDSEAYVFATANGSSLSPRNVLRDFRAAIAAATKVEAQQAEREKRDPVKLPPIRLHDLRHTHATLLMRANVHPKVVSERLGHASVRMTLDVYSHAVPTMQTEAATIAADMLAGPGPRLPKLQAPQKHSQVA